MFYKSKSQFRVNLGLMLEYSLLSPPLSLSHMQNLLKIISYWFGFFFLYLPQDFEVFLFHSDEFRKLSCGHCTISGFVGQDGFPETRPWGQSTDNDCILKKIVKKSFF